MIQKVVKCHLESKFIDLFFRLSAGGAGGGASLMGAPALLSLLPQGGLLQASKTHVLSETNIFTDLLPYAIVLNVFKSPTA